MIVLHASVYERHFFLWGEAPVEEVPRMSRRRGRQTQRSQPEQRRYDAGADPLLAALVEVGTGCVASRRTEALPGSYTRQHANSV
jgi:hypothetical protein